MEILKFYTETCMPCKVIGKMLDKLEGVKVTPVNAIADENIELVSEYNIFSTPTLVFLKEGKEVGRITGMTNESKIKAILEANETP